MPADPSKRAACLRRVEVVGLVPQTGSKGVLPELESRLFQTSAAAKWGRTVNRNTWTIKSATGIMLVLSFGLFGAVVQPSQAAPHPTPPDIAILARNQGLSGTEAMKTYGWQEDFNKYANQIEARYPDKFGAASITGPASAEMSFVGDVPQEVVPDAVPGATIALRGGLKASAHDLSEALSEKFLAARKSSVVATAYGDYDIISIDVQLKGDVQSAAARTAVKKKVSAAYDGSQKSIGAKIKFVKKSNSLRLQGDARGGAYLDDIDGSAACTWGFTVGKTGTSGGALGVSTAGHCATGSTRHYRNHDTTSYVSVARQTYSTSTDVGWYSDGSYTSQPYFYFDYNSYRGTSGTANPSVGSSVSNFGRTNGAHTGMQVMKKDFCAGTYCHLTAVNKSVTALGDSGGPWFFNNTAYGTLTGTVTISGKSYSAFTPVSYLSSVLSLTVLTT